MCYRIDCSILPTFNHCKCLVKEMVAYFNAIWIVIVIITTVVLVTIIIIIIVIIIVIIMGVLLPYPIQAKINVSFECTSCVS
jgi:hypothetical protein